MTEPEIRACTSVEEVVSALAPISHYFGSAQPEPTWAERFTRSLPPDRMHAAWEGDRAVAGAGVFPFELTVPGGAVRAAGVTVVAVLPTHRRRGLLRALMRAQLDDVRARGEPVAYLWASEETIYGRFGYGVAAQAGEVRIPRDRAALRGAPRERATIRLLSEAESLELIPPVYDRVRLQTPGMFGRPRAWWESRRLSDPPERRKGGVLNRALVEVAGEPAGYALYRMTQEFEAGSSVGHVEVVEALGATPEATREVWRFLLELDWTSEIRASLLPPDHPLFLLLAEPRRAGYRLGDGVWTRLVDLPAALAARSYRSGEPVVFEVEDAFLPANTGRWRLADGAAERTSDDPDLRVDVSALGSVYLGGFTFAQLLRAGAVEEAREGGAARADELFATDRLPWCPEIF